MRRILKCGVVAALVAVAGCHKTPQWQSYTSQEGQYTIQMPGAPAPQTRQQAGLTNHIDVVDLGSVAYMVSYTDLPPGKQGDLDGGVRGAVNGAQGELVQSRNIMIEGNPGREFTFKISGQNMKGAAQMFTTNTRLYQMLVVGTNVDLSSPDVQRFLTSFKLEK